MLKLTVSLIAALAVAMIVLGDDAPDAPGDAVAAASTARPDRPSTRTNAGDPMTAPLRLGATGETDTLGGQVIETGAPSTLAAAPPPPEESLPPLAEGLPRPLLSDETGPLGNEIEVTSLGLSDLQEQIDETLLQILPEVEPEVEVLPNLIPDPIEWYRVTGTRVNVRAGPSTENEVVDSVVAEQEVEVIELLDNGWAYIRIDGLAEGYMSAQFLAKVN